MSTSRDSRPPGPLVLAPMAGGPSTPQLVAEVSKAGMTGVLPAGYLTAGQLADTIATVRALTDEPFGVNVFVPSERTEPADLAATEYAVQLGAWAAAAGVSLGPPRWDDDDYPAKVDLLVADPLPWVPFAFGWPSARDVARLQDAGSQVWVTLNRPDEAQWAEALGVDGVIAQGWEAGGHRGGPVDDGLPQPSTRELLEGILAVTDLPVMSAGGVMTGAQARSLLDAGAVAVAFGTAFLLCPEAGTAPVHRFELTAREETVVTRAFTGRSARALVTSWTEVFRGDVPAACPQIHHLTAPLRTHGKATGEADLVHLWAGTGRRQARALPARELATLLLQECGAHA